MTTRRPGRMPVSSFGPELLAALVRGATEEINIPCDTEKQMMHLQLRLQSLRGSMGREKHPQYELVCKARTSRQWDTKEETYTDAPGVVKTRKVKYNFRLRIAPNDMQFRDILAKAGVKVEPRHSDILESPTTSIPVTPPVEGATEETSVDLDYPPLPTDPYAKFK